MARPLLLALAIAQAVASNTTTSCACDVGSLVLTGPNGNSTVYIKDATPIGGQGDRARDWPARLVCLAA